MEERRTDIIGPGVADEAADKAEVERIRGQVRQLLGEFFEAAGMKRGQILVVGCSSSEIEKRYGFIYVDYDNQFNGTGKRSLKDSYYWYKKVTASNGEDLG